MAGAHVFRRKGFGWFLLGTGGTLVIAAAMPDTARADVFIANGYHSQETPFYCGTASMEMVLDSPAIIGTNANVATGLAERGGAERGRPAKRGGERQRRQRIAG